MTAPDYVSGVVCDAAAVVAIANDLARRRKDGAGARLYDRARDEGLTLGVPLLAAVRAAGYLDPPGGMVLGALLFPERFRPVGDPLRVVGPRGVWWLIDSRPEDLAEHQAMLGRCGDPLMAFVAAYAAAMGWPVATDRPASYAALLGRDDAVVMPALEPGAV
ncbi:hypothetical protein [Micromonospora sp. CPCC 206061]|uniref:hypothetical protein n=1 Tax=Micromonospora sp. CPCC 206061 TaxID=3122410 RepID=UPI002FEF3E3B